MCKVYFSIRWNEHMSPFLRDLKWLKVSERRMYFVSCCELYFKGKESFIFDKKIYRNPGEKKEEENVVARGGGGGGDGGEGGGTRVRFCLSVPVRSP
ncbi:hypothetical protein ALC56_03834 [Trachymyrmex septentrionalis]|uniref:Uncharacterized protein n=1 Tax=Trachymyrmex septentrionalis TaxID=34720 RepID=A0A195FMQ8_9HYME|nr:hypothetical protein ALC56_03834 [Trachymyrmex septentrionalis]